MRILFLWMFGVQQLIICRRALHVAGWAVFDVPVRSSTACPCRRGGRPTIICISIFCFLAQSRQLKKTKLRKLIKTVMRSWGHGLSLLRRALTVTAHTGSSRRGAPALAVSRAGLPAKGPDTCSRPRYLTAYRFPHLAARTFTRPIHVNQLTFWWF